MCVAFAGWCSGLQCLPMVFKHKFKVCICVMYAVYRQRRQRQCVLQAQENITGLGREMNFKTYGCSFATAVPNRSNKPEDVIDDIRGSSSNCFSCSFFIFQAPLVNEMLVACLRNFLPSSPQNISRTPADVIADIRGSFSFRCFLFFVCSTSSVQLLLPAFGVEVLLPSTSIGCARLWRGATNWWLGGHILQTCVSSVS